jgi:hypothetical protein
VNRIQPFLACLILFISSGLARADKVVRPTSMNSARLCGILSFLFIGAIASVKGHGTLETVFSDPTYQLIGVAVTPNSRIFVSYPYWQDKHKYSVVEVAKDGTVKPFPDETWNSFKKAKTGRTNSSACWPSMPMTRDFYGSSIRPELVWAMFTIMRPRWLRSTSRPTKSYDENQLGWHRIESRWAIALLQAAHRR